MSERTAISVRGLGKRYRLGRALSLDDGLREVLAAAARRVLRGAPAPASRQTFWALRDVSFDVPAGSALGIVGRNGAGKSTLLKVLGRITPPTAGEARVDGRVASLLEVGTGFQPDLTGRENVYLNGAILGMRRRVVTSRFHEIVAFAGVERFVDTPVKRYSSGMFMRLAFSVAAHLDARILLVDEVLAVGDIEFQNRCLSKMDDIADSGRTVLFVSHKLGAVRRLCPRALYLEGGRLVAQGETGTVLSRYMRDSLGAVSETAPRATGSRFASWRVCRDGAGEPHGCVSGEPVRLEVALELDRPVEQAWFQLALWGPQDEIVMSASSRDDGAPAARLAPGRYTLVVDTRFPLSEGEYVLEVALSDITGRDLERAQLLPRLLVLPGSERVLPPAQRGIVDEAVAFRIAPATEEARGVRAETGR